MRTVLYMAVSADGFIAGPHDETPWSDDDWQAFQAFVKTCDAVLLGRRTYEIMKQDGDFVGGVEYIVATSDPSFDAGEFRKLNIQSLDDLPQVDTLGVIGGGQLNGSLAKLRAIDEVILDIEPILLGSGIHLFGSYSTEFGLELLESRRLGAATVQNHYRIVTEK